MQSISMLQSKKLPKSCIWCINLGGRMGFVKFGVVVFCLFFAQVASAVEVDYAQAVPAILFDSQSIVDDRFDQSVLDESIWQGMEVEEEGQQPTIAYTSNGIIIDSNELQRDDFILSFASIELQSNRVTSTTVDGSFELSFQGLITGDSSIEDNFSMRLTNRPQSYENDNDVRISMSWGEQNIQQGVTYYTTSFIVSNSGNGENHDFGELSIAQDSFSGLDFEFRITYDSQLQTISCTLAIEGVGFTTASIPVFQVASYYDYVSIVHDFGMAFDSPSETGQGQVHFKDFTSDLAVNHFATTQAQFFDNGLQYELTTWMRKFGEIQLLDPTSTFFPVQEDVNLYLMSNSSNETYAMLSTVDQSLIDDGWVQVDDTVDNYYEDAFIYEEGTGYRYMIPTDPYVIATVPSAPLQVSDLFYLSAVDSKDANSHFGTNDDIVSFEWWLDNDFDGIVSTGDTLLNQSSAFVTGDARGQEILLDASQIAAGEHQLVLEATDQSGRSASTTAAIEIEVAIPMQTEVPYVGLFGGDAGCSSSHISLGGGGWRASVNLVSGNLYFQQQYLAGTPHLDAPRMSYNHQATGTGVLGEHWTHSMQHKLWKQGTAYELKLQSGASISFREQGNRFIPVEGCCNGSVYLARELVVDQEDIFRVIYVGGGFEDYARSTGQLIRSRTRQGQRTYYEYSQTGLLERVEDHWGRAYQLQYDQFGRIEKIIAPDNSEQTIQYSAGRIANITDARGFSDQFAYDVTGRIQSIVDRDGYTWTIEYDETNRVSQIIDEHSNGTVFDYQPNQTLVTDRRGATRIYDYDANLNVLTSITDSLGRQKTSIYDSNGDLISQTDEEGNTTTYQYNQFHLKTQTTNALGDVMSTTYNNRGLPLESVDYNGNHTTFEYDAKMNLISVTNALGDQRTMTYNNIGLLLTSSNELGQTTTFNYRDGLQRRVVDPNGNRMLYSPDAMGRVIETVDQIGEIVSLEYDAMGNRVAEVLQDGFVVTSNFDALNRFTGSNVPLIGHSHSHNVVSQTFDINGFRTSATDFLGNTHTDSYDEEGLIIATATAEGRERRFHYDGEGQVMFQEDDEGTLLTSEYDLRGLPVVDIDARGETNVSTLDELGRATQTQNLVQGFTRLTQYDANGNSVVENFNGRETLFTYDELNRVHTVQDPEGNVYTNEYDKASRVVAVVDGLGRRTENVFDDGGRVIERIHPDGSTESWTYTRRNNVRTYTDPEGNVTRFQYDARGRQITRIDPEGSRWRTEYDSLNRVVAKVQPNGQRYKYVYDDRNLLIETIDPIGRSTSMTYDADGNVLTKTYPDGTVSEWTYTATKGLVATFTADTNDPASTVHYEYDLAGQLIRYTDENGNAKQFEYDTSGQQIAYVNELGYRVESILNPDNLLVGKQYSLNVSGAGSVPGLNSEQTLTYDLNKRLVRKISENDSSYIDTEYVYDQANQPIRMFGSIQTPAGTRVFDYEREFDDRGRLISEELLGQAPVVSSYDNNSQRLGLHTGAVSLATDHGINYFYDGQRRLTAATDLEGRTWSMEYDRSNRRRWLWYPDGSSLNTRYDEVNRVKYEAAWTADGELLWTERHTYDLRDNIIRTRTESDIRKFEYNARNWLTEMRIRVIDPDGSSTLRTIIRYQYDDVGNMTQQRIIQRSNQEFDFSLLFEGWDGRPPRVNQTIIDYQYDAANRLIQEISNSVSGEIVVVDYEYDVAGNLITKTVSSDQGEFQSEYYYTADNRLMYTTSETGPTWYNYPLVEGGGVSQHTWPMGERTGYNEITNEVIYDKLSRHVLQESQDNNVRSLVLDAHRDHILGVSNSQDDDWFVYQNFRGDVRAVATTDSTIVDVRNYLPTGQTMQYDTSSQLPFYYGYRGKQVQLNGLQDFVNRAYDPVAGRATSFDPLRTAPTSTIGSIGGWNDYALLTPGSQVETDMDGLFKRERVRFGSARDDLISTLSGPLPYRSHYFGERKVNIDPYVFDLARSTVKCSALDRSNISRAVARVWSVSSNNCFEESWSKEFRNIISSTIFYCTSGIQKEFVACGGAAPLKSIFNQSKFKNAAFIATDLIGNDVLMSDEFTQLLDDGRRVNCVQGAFHEFNGDNKSVPVGRYTRVVFHEILHSFFALSRNFDGGHKEIAKATYKCRWALGIKGYEYWYDLEAKDIESLYEDLSEGN